MKSNLTTKKTQNILIFLFLPNKLNEKKCNYVSEYFSFVDFIIGSINILFSKYNIFSLLMYKNV